MSNIFYSQVDDAVQRELNARGNAGKNRTTADINFMAGKIANVQLTAYRSGSADPAMQITSPYGILGGRTVLGNRFQPSGDGGFLTNPTYPVTKLNRGDENTDASLIEETVTDYSRRIGPIITGVSVDIGDHSMGLLNKATVNISIPNPSRDLDPIEEVWFYPGRYVKIDIVYPDSAVITGANENLISTSSLFGSLPKEDVDKNLKKLYPSIQDLDKFKEQIRKLNEFSFQGLITSFDFSYTPDGTIDATISLTGTSNTYTDVTMLMNPNTKKDADKQGPSYTTVATSSVAELQAAGQPTGSGSTEFYGLLYQNFENLINSFKTTNQIDQDIPILIPFTTAITTNDTTKTTPEAPDRFILYGEMYPNTSQILNTFVAGPTGSLTVEQQRENFDKKYTPYTQTQRYITLGALISFINAKILPKLAGSAEQAQIQCDHTQQFSNYYPSLTSCVPKDILLLPHKTDLKQNEGGMNVYGDLRMYPDVLNKMASYGVLQWSGLKDTSTEIQRIYPSKIFINLEYIQQVLNGLSAQNTKSFTIGSFLQNISQRIAYATGNAIVMKLVSSPDNLNNLTFSDTKYLKSIDPDPKKKVTKYSVPMLANHVNGTIVQDFTFQAKLPSNVKNLSYVLNSGTDVSDDEIAPYLNFMYNSKDPDKINEARAKYKEKHGQILANLNDAKTEYGKIPFVDEHTTKLVKALFEYIKYPFDNITKAQQLTAPIFPFDADFTIDGINGLRYGDVLTFDALPEKYKTGTVFSIIGITHDVETSGQWKTKVKCIMRPEIG